MTADRKRIIYEGDFERGRIQGKGIYYYAQAENSLIQHRKPGTTPATNTAANSKNSTMEDDDTDKGSRYEGDFKENMRNGYGIYILPDKSVYNGQWRENMMNGRGVFTWPDHSVYDGEWKDGKRYVRKNL